MSNTNKMEVLFKELGDEDIADVSGGVSVITTASLSDDGTGKATLTVNNKTKTVNFSSTDLIAPNEPTDQPTTNSILAKKFLLPLSLLLINI